MSAITTILADGNLTILTCMTGVILIFYAYEASKKNIPYTENAVLLFAGLAFLFAAMYNIMFDVIAPLPFLLKATSEEKYNAILTSLLFVNAMIFGGVYSVAFSQGILPKRKINSAFKISQKAINQLFYIAYFTVGLSIVAYLGYFHSQPYVALHIDGGGVWGLALKFIYISYAVVCIVGLLEEDIKKYKLHLIFLTVMMVIVYGYLYKLRSPLMYYLLLLMFLYGRRFKIRTLIIIGVISILGLTGVALIRDASLVESGVGTGLLDMIVGLGAQVDSMIFVQHYVDSNGILSGIGFINGLLGLAEPITNDYARSISLEYFNDGGGFGFYLVSDFYLNFGFVFGMFAMFLFGLLLTNVRRNTSSFYTVVFLANIYADSFSLVRNDFGSSLRASIYTLITVFFLISLLKISTCDYSNNNNSLEVEK